MASKERDSGVRSKWGVLDFVFLLLTAAVLATLCIVRSKIRLMWSDEILGYTVLTAPSMGQTLAGWYQGADGGGVFYYLIGHVWMALFHPSALSLRLFSTCGFVLSMGLIWRCARRFYAFAPVAIAVLFVYLTPLVMMWQEVNGRFYGFFLFAAVLAVVAFLRTAEREHLTGADYVATGVVNAVLIGSHILGLVYSASLILAAVALDGVRRRLRWRLYLSGLAGWLMLPISWHAISSSTSIAEKIFWTQKPGFPELFEGFFLFDRWIYLLLFIAIGLNVLILMRGRGRASQETTDWRSSSRLAVYAVIGALFLAQAVLFAKSQFGISIYSDRYLLPGGAGLVLLIADGLRPLFEGSFFKRGASPWRGVVVAAAVLVVFSFRTLRLAPMSIVYPDAGYSGRLLSHLPLEKTVVVTFLPTFALLRTYDSTHHYIFLLDWKYDLSQPASKEDHSLQRLMDNWKRAGLAEGSILSCAEIVSNYSDFTLLTDPSRDGWLKDRLLNEPSLTVRPVSSYEEWYPVKIWAVQHLGPGPVCR